MFANLEGHGDTKNLLPTSQFLAGGIGGMVSQYVRSRFDWSGSYLLS